jgi:hypothetical protein
MKRLKTKRDPKKKCKRRRRQKNEQKRKRKRKEQGKKKSRHSLNHLWLKFQRMRFIIFSCNSTLTTVTSYPQKKTLSLIGACPDST